MLEHFRPHRVPVPDLEQRDEKTYGTQRYRCRPSKLTTGEIDTILRQPNRTLRELADNLGVSHETVRTIRKGRW